MAQLSSSHAFICIVVACGAFGYGFGFGVFVSSIGQPGFYVDLKLDPTSEYTAQILGAANGLFAFGAAAGAIVQGWTTDWIGRKKSLAVAGVITILGAALVAGSADVPMLLVVRIIHGFGLGMILCVVPLYCTEIAPAKTRGLFSGTVVMGYGIGYLIVSWVSVATYYAANLTLQWRLPLALATLGPIIMLAGLPFVPESPRYLCWIDHFDDARNILLHLHRSADDPDDLGARAEFIQIKTQVQLDKQQKAGYLQMFIKPSWRRRSLLVMFLFFASQSTGVTGISNYMIPIVTTLGYSGGTPLIIYAVYTSIGTVFVFLVTFTVDRVGRRTMFLFGYPIIAAVLLIEGLLQRQYLGTDNSGGKIACLVFMNLYIVFFQLADSPGFIWASEVLPTPIRAKGVGLAVFSLMAGFITFSAPGAVAFKNLQWGMFIIFSGLSVLSAIIIYFFIPETKGRPVEEIGELFGDYVALHLAANGQEIEEKPEGIEYVEKAVAEGTI